MLIIADDVSPDYFGKFSASTDTTFTPKLRALCNRGIRFTKVRAAPVCSPTRAGTFTERYPFRIGVGQVITNATTPPPDTGEVSIAELLRDKAAQKYNTACAGKWHLHVNTPAKRLDPNRSSDALLNTPDLFATIADLCGFATWKNFIPQDSVVESKSFLPIIRNQSTSTRYGIFTKQFQVKTASSDGKTIRDEDFQLLRFDNGAEQFCKKSTDPEENNNLLTATMTTTHEQHYLFLCDSLNALLGSGSCLPLSSLEVSEGPDLKIFTNPGSSQLRVQSKEPISKISLFDLCGRALMHTTDRRLDISVLSGGVYWLRVQFADGKSQTEKIRVNP